MSNVKVEKQEPQGPSSPGAFEEWYDTKFKHGFERGPNDKYVARKAWFAALYTAPQPCPECEERKTTALNYISLTFEFEQLQSKSEKLKALSVTNILIDVVPGDGSGLEIYAKSVSDVEALLSRLGEKAEDYDLLKSEYGKLKAERDDLAAQVEKMLNPADVLLEIVGRIQPFALPREEDTQQKRYERLRKAYCIAQPWPIPDQACLVWRADLMHMAGDLVHKQAYFDNEKRKRDSALAADMEAGKC